MLGCNLCSTNNYRCSCIVEAVFSFQEIKKDKKENYIKLRLDQMYTLALVNSVNAANTVGSD